MNPPLRPTTNEGKPNARSKTMLPAFISQPAISTIRGNFV
jgi:hypothetical protein